MSLLGVVPGAVGQLAFGRYLSPDYETADKFIPPVGTLLGVPAVQATVPVYFNLFLPAGTPPPGGWPVALFGHALTDNKNGTAFGGPFAVGLLETAQPGADEIPQLGVFRGTVQGLQVTGFGRQLRAIGFLGHFATSWILPIPS